MHLVSRLCSATAGLGLWEAESVSFHMQCLPPQGGQPNKRWESASQELLVANGEGRSPNARPEARRREAGVERVCSGADTLAAGTQWVVGSLLQRRDQSNSTPTEPLY